MYRTVLVVLRVSSINYHNHLCPKSEDRAACLQGAAGARWATAGGKPRRWVATAAETERAEERIAVYAGVTKDRARRAAPCAGSGAHGRRGQRERRR